MESITADAQFRLHPANGSSKTPGQILYIGSFLNFSDHIATENLPTDVTKKIVHNISK